MSGAKIIPYVFVYAINLLRSIISIFFEGFFGINNCALTCRYPCVAATAHLSRSEVIAVPMM